MKKTFSLALIALLAFCSAMFLSALSSRAEAGAAFQATIRQVNCNTNPSRYVQITDDKKNVSCFVKDGNGQEQISTGLPANMTAFRSVGYSGTIQGNRVKIAFEPGTRHRMNPAVVPQTLVIDAGPAK